MIMLVAMVMVAAQQPGAEIFKDKSDFFVRAGSAQGLRVGAELQVLGDRIGDTDEYRTAGRATVLEVWPTLARVSLDAGAQATLVAVPDGQPAGMVRLQRLPSVEAVAVEEPVPDRHGSVFLDPVGFLLFGPTAGVEVGGSRFSGAVYGRWLNAGLLSSVAIIAPTESFTFSFGVGLRFRFYFRDGLAGFHLGLAGEWLRTRVENVPLLVAVTSNYLVPQFDLGYRWAWGRFYLDLSGALGFTARLFWKTENLPGGTQADSIFPPAVTSAFGAARLDLGLFF